jgi:hypothetical protein
MLILKSFYHLKAILLSIFSFLNLFYFRRTSFKTSSVIWITTVLIRFSQRTVITLAFLRAEAIIHQFLQILKHANVYQCLDIKCSFVFIIYYGFGTAKFQTYSSTPAWSPNFSKTGGNKPCAIFLELSKSFQLDW